MRPKDERWQRLSRLGCISRPASSRRLWRPSRAGHSAGPRCKTIGECPTAGTRPERALAGRLGAQAPDPLGSSAKHCDCLKIQSTFAGWIAHRARDPSSGFARLEWLGCCCCCCCPPYSRVFASNSGSRDLEPVIVSRPCELASRRRFRPALRCR